MKIYISLWILMLISACRVSDCATPFTKHIQIELLDKTNNKPLNASKVNIDLEINAFKKITKRIDIGADSSKVIFFDTEESEFKTIGEFPTSVKVDNRIVGTFTYKIYDGAGCGYPQNSSIKMMQGLTLVSISTGGGLQLILKL